jgi:hypothetical protein
MASVFFGKNIIRPMDYFSTLACLSPKMKRGGIRNYLFTSENTDKTIITEPTIRSILYGNAQENNDLK